MSIFETPLAWRRKQPEANFRAGREPGPDDVFIAVMGVTGSGKSSFISLCSGKPVSVGHDLEACTFKVDVYAYEMTKSRTIYLIDTPGFDDSHRDDRQILTEVATWLGESYESDIKLTGIIYVHRITDVRMQGSAQKNLKMFRQLCGKDAFKKVVLATSRWDEVDPRVGVKRETELTETPEFWGVMMRKGSVCRRHDNTEASAKAIVHEIAKNKTTMTTEIQRQLVDEKKPLGETSAGQELESEILKEREKWTKELKDVEAQMREAIDQRDKEAEEVMREERDRYTRMIHKAEEDTDALRATMEGLIAARDERVSRIERQLQERQAAHDAELRDIRNQQEQLRREKAAAELRAEQSLTALQQRQQEELVRERALRQKAEQEKAHLEELELQRRTAQQLVTTPRPSTLQTQATTTTPTIAPARTVELPEWFVSLGRGVYFCSGPGSTSTNTTVFHRSWLRGRRVIMYSEGTGSQDEDDGTIVWTACLSDGTWEFAENFPRVFPDLRKVSLQSISPTPPRVKVLGPEGSYFVQWASGEYIVSGSQRLIKRLRKSLGGSTMKHVVAFAFGYGGSYVFSFTGISPGDSNWNYGRYGLSKSGLATYYSRLDSLIESIDEISLKASPHIPIQH